MLKRVILSVLSIILVFSLSGCLISGNNRGTARIGSGRMVEGEISADNSIKRIELRDVAATINISTVRSDKVSYKVDDNLEQYLNVKLDGDILKISSKQGMLGRDTSITFNVGTDALESLYIASAANIKGEGTFKPNAFTADINGAARVDMDIVTSNIDATVNGAAILNLSGKADSLDITANGASEVKALDLIARDVDINFAGASTVQVYAEDTLNVTGAGAGTVRYKGDPTVTKSTFGIATVTKIN